MKYYITIVMIFLTISLSNAERQHKADIVRGKKIAESVCVACHSVDGNPSVSMYPRLAQQYPNYIYKQVKNIRDEKRTWGLASAMLPMIKDFTPDTVGQEVYDVLVSLNIHNNFSNQDLWDVSTYYSQQIGTSGETDPNPNTLVALGANIYKGGIFAKNIPACMACHGPSGNGIPGGSEVEHGIAAFPRITGQNKDYVVTQLQAFKSGDRKSAMMSDLSKRLSDEEIDAVANYIQGLK